MQQLNALGLCHAVVVLLLLMVRVRAEGPTFNPSRKPTAHPSSWPTHRPSPGPSRIPTPSPTHDPSPAPTSRPSQRPSPGPSTTPTIAPSAKPTTPTSVPTSVPSTQPSSQPSSMPTAQPSSDDVRYFYCSQCQHYAGGYCTFLAPRIILMCPHEKFGNICKYDVEKFIIEPGANITIDGDCDLVITATSYVYMSSNSSLTARTINITVPQTSSGFSGVRTKGQVTLAGTLETSGLGPYMGEGAPDKATQGWGGSYGGSGGRPACEQVFSNTRGQIGSTNVFNNSAPATYSEDGMITTVGSGGGHEEAGRGGGRVVITGGAVTVMSTGSIVARGSAAPNYDYGSGSGGSVLIRTKSINGHGSISVAGGDSFGAAGAGGGGRIGLEIEGNFDIMDLELSLDVQGGRSLTQDPSLASSSACRNGGWGTIYMRDLASTGDQPGQLVVGSRDAYQSNSDDLFAGTIIEDLPPHTTSIISAYAIILTPLNITLASLGTCAPSWQEQITWETMDFTCSRFALHRTGLHYYDRNYTDVIYFGNRTTVKTAAAQYMRYPDMAKLSVEAETMLLENGATITTSTLMVHRSIAQSISAIIVSMGRGTLVDVSIELRIALGLSGFFEGSIEPNERLYEFHEELYRSFNRTTPGQSSVVIESSEILWVYLLKAVNIRIASRDIVVGSAGLIASPQTPAPVTSCFTNTTDDRFSCTRGDEDASAGMPIELTNNTFFIKATNLMSVGESAQIHASVVIICAEDIEIFEDAIISSDGKGCLTNQGSSTGGCGDDHEALACSGGGNGGEGGWSGGLVQGGAIATVSNKTLSSGSGGGCLTYSFTGSHAVDSTHSSGGGIVKLAASRQIIHGGTISSDGQNGQDDVGGCGGGAGGTVSLNAQYFSGIGTLKAVGGRGGAGLVFGPAGGGGGGGIITINVYNTQSSIFDGYLAAAGGKEGHRDRDSEYAQATAGSPGEIMMPVCDKGYGNNYSSGRVCHECSIAYYKDTVSSDACVPCENKRGTSHYIYCHTTTYADDDPKEVSDCIPDSFNCPYECDPGYSNEQCFASFQHFVFGVGSWACTPSERNKAELFCAYVGAASDILFFILAILLIIILVGCLSERKCFDRLRFRKRGSKDGGVLGKNQMWEYVDRDSVTNPMATKLSPRTEEKLNTEDAQKLAEYRIRAAQLKAAQIESQWQNLVRNDRKALRLTEGDLEKHACRIYFLGSNHPSREAGGQWVLSPVRPVTLRPTLNKRKYAEFASDVNAAVAWERFSWEMAGYYALFVFFPPFVPTYMKWLRNRRARRLVEIFMTYNHAMFRSEKLRQNHSRCMRLNISSDATLAYIDVLYDTEKFDRGMRPLGPVGQVKLPLSLKLSGIGTYSTPWQLDTDDLLLQGVPEAGAASSFIDSAWIDFIAQVNTYLRCMHRSSLRRDVLRLCRFLSREQSKDILGGVVAKLCIYSNQPVMPASEVDTFRKLSVSRYSRRLTIVKRPDSIHRQDTRLSLFAADDSAHRQSKNFSFFNMFKAEKNVKRESEQSKTAESAARGSESTSDVKNSSPAEFHSLKHLPLECEKTGRDSTLSDDSDGGFGLQGANAIYQAVRGRFGNAVTTVNRSASKVRNYSVSRLNSIQSRMSQFSPDEFLRNSGRSSAGRSSSKSSPRPSAVPSSQKMPEKKKKAKWFKWLRFNAMFKRILRAINEIGLNLGIIFHAVDPESVGQGTMTFDELLYGVQTGQLSLGIMITHKHVEPSNKLLCDDDYSSETDGGLALDETTGGQRLSITAQELASSRRNSQKKKHRNTQERIYGEKVKELSKFYNIVKKAESHMDVADQEPTTRAPAETTASSNYTDTRTSTMESLAEEYPKRHVSADSNGGSDGETGYKHTENFQGSENKADSTKGSGQDDAYFDFNFNSAGRVQSIDADRNSTRSFSRDRRSGKAVSFKPKAVPALHVDTGGDDDNDEENARCTEYDVKKIDGRKMLRSLDISPSGHQTNVDIMHIDGNLLFIQRSLRGDDDSESDCDENSYLTTADGLPKESRGSSSKHVSGISNDGVFRSVSSPVPSPHPSPRPSPHPSRMPTASFADVDAGLRGSASPTNASSAKSPMPSRSASRQISHVPTNINEGLTKLLLGERYGSKTKSTTTGGTNSRFGMEIDRKKSCRQQGYDMLLGAVRWFLGAFPNMVFGSNTYPVGSRVVRLTLSVFIVIACLLDLGASCTILVEYRCLWGSTRLCENPTALVLPIVIGSGALLFSPISGILAIALGPSPTLARTYAYWSRMAILSTVVLIVVYVYKGQKAQHQVIQISLGLYASSRILQCLFIDLYVAHVDAIRWSRSWAGLSTSSDMNAEEKLNPSY